MRISRWLATFASTLVCGAAAAQAADTWPQRPIHLVVNGAAGSLPDMFARPLADRLHAVLGQTIVVENKPGAGGLLAMQQVKQSPADGQTFAIVTNAHMVWNPHLFAKMPYDPATDIAPVSPLAVLPMAMAVSKDLPVSSLAEFVAYAKARPGELNYASSGNGSPPHVLFELFQSQAGTKFVHVPFRSGPDALNALLAQDVQAYLAGTALVQNLIGEGRLKVIGVGAAEPQPNLPGVATFADAGFPGYEQAIWLGVVTREGVDPAIIERMNGAIQQALQDPALIRVFESHGSLPYPGSAQDFKARIEADRTLWAPILEKAGITPG